MKLHKDYSTEFDKLNLVQFLYGEDLKKSNIRAYKYKIKKYITELNNHTNLQIIEIGNDKISVKKLHNMQQ